MPYKALFVLCCMVLSESFSITMIFPFLANMVLDFGLTDNLDEVGFYAGWIASCFNIAQFSSSFGWGWLSDKVGRKPVLIVGLAGNFLMIILFGFSKDLWYAILARSLNGFLNGNIGVVKTYLSEITDNTNAHKGFSIFGLCWGTGLIIGPSIGGFLSKPSEKIPHIFPPGSLLDQFPYLLPCIASATVTLLGLIMGIFFLQETLHIKKDKEKEEDPLVPKAKPNEIDIEEVEDEIDINNTRAICFSFFTSREIMITTLLYSLLTFHRMMLDEVFAIWAPLKPSEGGISFTSSDIGLIYAVAGASGLVSQFFIFPYFVDRFGTLTMYRWSSFISFFLNAILPVVSEIATHGTWAVWLSISAIFVLFSIINNFLFITVMVLITNSAPSKLIGSVNGFAQTWASALRSIAPTIAGYVLAWSLTNGLSFPLNHYFTFFFIALFSLVTFILTFFLDKSIDKRKKTK
uniref:Major facilitator superfamily (MFS) profile domain-containing protein n=1 Tax=Arcella intermedia TaxID=1963864 RepID=A0A6B2L3I2_9EUKA